MTRRLLTIAACTLFSLSSLLPLHAQTVVGTLLGQVTDASGGVVSKASVSLRNVETNRVVETVTDASGNYLAPNLQPGTYEITITAPGYRTGEIHNVRLLLNATARNDLQLAVGSADQKVEVSSAGSVIATDSSSLNAVIDMKAGERLPLNGRTIDRLVQFTPGNTADNASAPKIGGSLHWSGSYFTVDGGAYNDVGNGQGSYSYATNLTTMPSTELIQEMKIESNLAKAEYEGSAAISMLTKSGTNQFHGTLYEFNRNRFVAARDYFARAGTVVKPPFNRNEFGVLVGGPIWKDRTFFFGAAEYLMQRTSSTYVMTVATDAMRSGDFTGVATIKDPTTGLPYANNKLPSIDSRATALLQYYPRANQSGLVNNFVQAVGTQYDVKRYNLKLDHQLTQKNQLTVGGNFSLGNPYFVALGTPANYGNYGNAGYYTQSAFVRDTATIRQSMVNEARYGYFSHRSVRVGQNTNFDPSTIFPGLYGPFAVGGLPTMNINGYTKIGDYGGSGYGGATQQQLSDNFTYQHGKHTVKVGALANLIAIWGKSGTNSNVLGTFNMDGRYTGNAFADFLAGYPYSTARATKTQANYTHYEQYGFFGQDDWQLSSRLTLNVGFRYNLQTAFRQSRGNVTNFDPATGNFVIRSVGGKISQDAQNSPALGLYPYVRSEDNGWGSTMFTSDKKNFGPRFGFAYRPFANDQTVLRGGYGIFYNFVPFYIGPNQLMSSNYPFSLTQTYTTSSSTTPTLTFANPFPGSGTVTANPTVYMVNRDLKNARVQQWNLTVEQVLPANVGVRLSYVGNKATQVPFYLYNVNLPSVQRAASTLQAIRPYQPWSDILGLITKGAAFTNQMQLSVTKRTGHGLFIQASYTWSKSLDNVGISGSPQNPYRPQDDRGLADSQRKHNLYVSATYQLPFKGTGLKGGLVKGWSISTMTAARSGLPFTPTFTSTTVGWYATRANVVPGVDPYAGAKTRNKWFNPAAFSVPAPFTFGNARRNSLIGPALNYSDLSVEKKFEIRERVGLQLRFDAFNAFNHANFSTPASNISVATAGTISSTTSSGSNRQVQLGGKITF